MVLSFELRHSLLVQQSCDLRVLADPILMDYSARFDITLTTHALGSAIKPLYPFSSKNLRQSPVGQPFYFGVAELTMFISTHCLAENRVADTDEMYSSKPQGFRKRIKGRVSHGKAPASYRRLPS